MRLSRPTLIKPLVGEHISEQLTALNLYWAMMEGTTPTSLPFTFTDCER